MPQLKTLTYTRTNWQIGGSRIYEKYGVPKPKTADDFWVPETKLRLREAVTIIGEKNISEWDGSESAARLYNDPPERPWPYFYTECIGNDCVIFANDGSRELVDEATAEAWWSTIEAEIYSEWEAEQRAVDRWQKAVHAFRSLLTESVLVSELLTDDGVLMRVDTSEWRAQRARGFFTDGIGRIAYSNGYVVRDFEGVFLIDRADLSNYLAGEYDGLADESSGQPNVPIVDTDKTVEAQRERMNQSEGTPAISASKSLGTRERESLLKLVIGMAVKGYAYNPKASRNSATGEIADDLRLLGISLDEDTIRKYLAEGRDLLPGDETE